MKTQMAIIDLMLDVANAGEPIKNRALRALLKPYFYLKIKRAENLIKVYHNKNLIGYVLIEKHTENIKSLHLGLIKEYRSMGIGKMLINKYTSEGNWVFITTDMHGTEGFYKSVGCQNYVHNFGIAWFWTLYQMKIVRYKAHYKMDDGKSR